ncbi:nitrous oxide-stimulated promoter family protein [Geomonas subterranea]|uniref:Nitrous oxide-stimulated promoter family protein n=1 Tax=Geomonas subterranea TaxID=2847989 RepID=A0ABX8LQU9_9BACT|nr:nitrous oxide-stimulated promoter family protein [Geomonas subterranea]QXE92664.1 nitrous oxide-stimulated promoter family protein [Geomonas subterranea]QXM09237.1 nitrous oxide-stimulated promoter family protein [Geomonas subterranea]
MSKANIDDDLRTLVLFIETYCRGKHQSPKGALCQECRELLAYSESRRKKCPLDPKPTCNDCKIHCYGNIQRAKIREVMAYSGRRLLLRGRVDLLWHFFKHG